MVIFHSYVKLPEGKSIIKRQELLAFLANVPWIEARAFPTTKNSADPYHRSAVPHRFLFWNQC